MPTRIRKADGYCLFMCVYNLENSTWFYFQAEIKAIQGKIVTALNKILAINCSPATRQQLAKYYATLFNVGTTMGLFDSVNKFFDIIKSRDDSPKQLEIRL